MRGGRASSLSSGTDEHAAVLVDEGAAVPRGSYDLWLNVEGADLAHPAQRAVYAGALTQSQPPLFTRASGPAGPFELSLYSALPPFAAGQDNVFAIAAKGADAETADCRLTWQLLADGNRSVAEGDGGQRCDRPEVMLPADVAPGRYRLQLAAWKDNGSAGQLSDVIVVGAVVR